MGESAAIDPAIRSQPAAEAPDAAQHAKAAAFSAQVAVRAAAALARGDVQHAGHGMRAVQRRTRPSQNFDSVDIDDIHRLVEGGSVTLPGSSVAKAQAVDQHRRVVIAHAASLDGREAARSAQLLNPHSGDAANGLAKRELVA